MRNLLIILLFILTACENTPPSPGNTYDYEGSSNITIVKLAEAIRTEYAPNATVYILSDQPLSYGISGLANQLGEHSYLIQISRYAPNPQSTVFHEMGHIIDAERGRLDFRGDMGWDGKKCDWEIPWAERPWEVSANEWRDCIWYEYENRQLKHYDYASDAWFKMYPISLFLFK